MSLEGFTGTLSETLFPLLVKFGGFEGLPQPGRQSQGLGFRIPSMDPIIESL